MHMTPSISFNSRITPSRRSSHCPRYFIPEIKRPALVCQKRRMGLSIHDSSSAFSSLLRCRSICRIVSHSSVVFPVPCSPISSQLPRSDRNCVTNSATSRSRSQARPNRDRTLESPSGSAIFTKSSVVNRSLTVSRFASIETNTSSRNTSFGAT